MGQEIQTFQTQFDICGELWNYPTSRRLLTAAEIMRRGETMYLRFSTGTLCLALALMATGCRLPTAQNALPVAHNLPPAQMLMEPGPGVGGPGPGVMTPPAPMGMPMAPAPTVQVRFEQPEAMNIQWDVASPGMYDSAPSVVPFSQNFSEGGIYRLKVSQVEGREDETYYPTLEVGPISPRTAAYLAHSAIPVQLTEEDFAQAMVGNFVTKVIYLPDPEFQELALPGVNTIVSTRLDPGVDPVTEADRRGAILAIVRMGNKKMEGDYGDSLIQQAAFSPAGAAGPQGGGHSMLGAPMPYMGGGHAGNYISGLNAPPYGMPHTGTPIGLPGPPHIPLGVPAGLQKHTMHNHTAMHIPGPTPALNMHVRQDPGLSYPRPADTVKVREQTLRPPHFNQQPPFDQLHINGSAGGDCPPY